MGRHAPYIAVVWIGMTAVGVGGCADDPDPRIITSFRQSAPFNYSTKLEGAYYYYNSPTVVGNYVYIGTSRKTNEPPGTGNYFFKLDKDLKKVWEYALGYDEVRGGAALDAQGRIYFVVEKDRTFGDSWSGDDFLYCLSNDGQFQWEFPISSPGAVRPRYGYVAIGMINPAVAADGTIYVGGGKLYALSSSGAEIWEYPAGSYEEAKNAPIIDPDGNIYFFAEYGLHSLRPDGTQRWQWVGGYGVRYSSPAFSFDYSRIFVAMNLVVYCIDTATGVEIWSFIAPEAMGYGDFRATPAVDDTGNVYIGSHADRNSALYAIRPDGTLLWENHLGAEMYSSPALGNDRTVYVGSEFTDGERRFHAFDMASGAKKWSVKIPGRGDVTWSSPALVEGGVIYVGSMNGSVYAIRSDATGLLPNAGSPRFHGGNSSTGRRE